MTTTVTPSAVVAPIDAIFAINDYFILQALDGLTHEEVWRALTERNNAMLWVAGHAVQTRAMVLQMLGEPIDTGWGNLFDRGAKVGDAGSYPSQEEIQRVMRDISPRLHAKLASLKDDYLAEPATMQLPGTQTVADELAFFALHDSYHVGQMVYIRKGLGYPGLTG
jgi:hypothetical protein